MLTPCLSALLPVDSNAAAKAARLTGVHAALLSAIPYAAAVAGLTLVGWHSKRTGERHWHSALPTAVAAFSLW